MVITNQGVAIQPGFSSKTTCSFENRPIGCVYKTETKHASKDGIELAIFKAFREFLLAVWFFRLRLAVLLGKLLDGFSLVHTGVYGSHKQTHNK